MAYGKALCSDLSKVITDLFNSQNSSSKIANQLKYIVKLHNTTRTSRSERNIGRISNLTVMNL